MYFEQSRPVLNNRTYMVGKWDNPADAYALGDAVLLPSPSEGGRMLFCFFCKPCNTHKISVKTQQLFSWKRGP